MSPSNQAKPLRSLAFIDLDALYLATSLNAMKYRIRRMFLIWLAFVPSGGYSAELSDQQSAWLHAAERHERTGWIYLHIEGSPRERGFQHGYLLAPEIAEGFRFARADWLHQCSLDWSWLVSNTNSVIASGGCF